MSLTVTFKDKVYDIKAWSCERLARLVCIDTETTVTPSFIVPELVLFQAFDGINVYTVDIDKIQSFFNINFANTFIMHNASFDMSVLSKYIDVYLLYDENRVKDTLLLYRLLHLGTIGFVPPLKMCGLGTLSSKFLNIELDKSGDERTTFGQYLGKKVSEMGVEHIKYACKDVIATYQLYQHLSIHIREVDKLGTELSHDIQAKGDWALKQIHINGIGFDLANRDKWLIKVNKELKKLSTRLANWGWVRGLKGSKERYKLIVERLGIADQLPRSEKSGDISSKREDLEKFKHLDFVDDYLSFIELEKSSTFVRDVTSSRLHPRYNSLVNTGRTSCSSPNIQQIPRKGGLREMFIPSKGNVFVDIDYSTLELATLAQVELNQFGTSTMGDKINAGEDLHKFYASILYSKDIKDITKDERQAAKPANFGFSGALGIVTFIEFAKGYNIKLTEEQAKEMKKKWFEAFPEEELRLKSVCEGMVYTATGRARDGATHCAVANTPFQGLAADGAKLALYEVDKAGYEIVAFIHDQIMIECKKEDANKALKDVSKIMIKSMNQVVPDIKIDVEGQVLERWVK